MSFPGSVLLSGADVIKTTTAKIHPLGTRGYTRDGRAFRYSRNGGTALIAGLPVQSSVPLANATTTRIVTGTTALSANSSRVKIMSGSSHVFTSKNAFADGFMYLGTSSTAKGAAVYAQVKGHTTGGTSTKVSALVLVDLVSGDELFAPDAAAKIGTTAAKVRFVRNPYDKTIVQPSGVSTAPIMGIPVRSVAANAYFWVQTWGPCPVRSAAKVVNAGLAVGASTGTSARVIGTTDSSKGTSHSMMSWRQLSQLGDGVGTVMVTTVSGEYNMVFLKLAP